MPAIVTERTGAVNTCSQASEGGVMPFTLNYDDAIHLDAEALAEGGIAEIVGGRRRTSPCT
jgi:hypothetical protein